MCVPGGSVSPGVRLCGVLFERVCCRDVGAHECLLLPEVFSEVTQHGGVGGCVLGSVCVSRVGLGLELWVFCVYTETAQASCSHVGS